MGMIDPGGKTGIVEKALLQSGEMGRLGADDLEGDVPIERLIDRLIDDRESPPPDFVER